MQKFEDQMKRIYKKYLIEPQSEKPESGKEQVLHHTAVVWENIISIIGNAINVVL